MTPREREVLDLLVAGKANKMIAYLLGTSHRTIEHHRAIIMDKMQADAVYQGPIGQLAIGVAQHRG